VPVPPLEHRHLIEFGRAAPESKPSRGRPLPLTKCTRWCKPPIRGDANALAAGMGWDSTGDWIVQQ
jgi:hypothetical protein